jgi:hypothetical protein
MPNYLKSLNTFSIVHNFHIFLFQFNSLQIVQNIFKLKKQYSMFQSLKPVCI